MTRLLSKIVAGGLSAAVILLWWPLVFPSDTVESWLARGVLWTLCFELMLHAFGPLEESLWRSHAARRVRERAREAGQRLGSDTPQGRAGGRTAIAAVALLVPLALLATAPRDSLAPKPVRASVKHVTQVKRVVRVERRTVAVPRATTVARPAPPRAVDAPTQSAGVPLAERPVSRASGYIPQRRTSYRRTGPASGGQTRVPKRPDTADQAPAAGADERSATAPIAQPKPRVVAAPRA